MTFHPPGFHGVHGITECRDLDVALVEQVAILLIEDDLETASAEFDRIADENQLLKWQRERLKDSARTRRVQILRAEAAAATRH